ncbi:MAG: T9SS type A sorting domain-containing protein [Bacteroidota bacterium]
MRHSLWSGILLALVLLLAHERSALSLGQPHTPGRASSTSKFTLSTWLDANLVKVKSNNRGGLATNVGGGYGGGFWPDTLKARQNVILFDFGPWVIGKVNGVPKMGLSQWGTSYSPGPAINGQAAMVAMPLDSVRYRVYKIRQGDNATSNPDYRDWPVDLGAPVDQQGKPRLLGDQMLWSVFNNIDPTAPSDWWQTHMPNPGLPVVIQQSVYARTVPGGDPSALLENVAFIEWTIINVGPNPIESTYVSLWTDIDFNDSQNNRPAIDTTNQLGYCWQFRDDDYLKPPRAVGFVWLYGPSVPSPGDQSVFKGRERADSRNLPITSFWGIQDDSFQDSSFRGPAYSMGTAWNIARGFDKGGNPVLDSVTHQVTNFLYNGDPITGTGWLCPSSSGGAGFNLFSGPFTLAPGDTQWVMAALIPVSDTSRLQCVTLLREAAAKLRSESYDSFIVTSATPEANTLPLTVRLEQNYPNPFNPSTTIRFALPHRSHILLAVYNALGQRVAELENGDMDAGFHEVQFEGRNLASGVYFYRLSTGSFVDTKRLILLK